MKVIIVDPSCFTMPYDHCLCEALTRQGCNVSFFASRYLYGHWHHATHYQRVDYFYKFTNWLYRNKPSGFLRREIKGIEHFGNMLTLVDKMRALNPSIIHFQWIPIPSIDAFLVDRFRTIAPVVLTIHNIHPYQNAPSSIIQKWRFTAALQHFDHLIVHTKSSFRTIVSRKIFPKSKVSIIPHGIFNYYQQSKNMPENSTGHQKTVVFFGAIKPYKGVDVLIHAFAHLPRDIIASTKLLIAGYPKMNVQSLQELAVKLGISNNVEWLLGYIPEAEIPSILQKATVFVLPYKEIDQSGVLMAILAFGKPIVASRIAGLSEVLKDNIHGYLVEPNDPSKLASGLTSILKDKTKMKRMSTAVRSLAQKDFSWDSIAAKTIALYKKISGKKPLCR